MSYVPSVYRPFGFLRLFLAIMVVVSHTRLLASESFSSWVGPHGLGNMAVMVFFVLSGFVIAEANDIFYRSRTGAFIVNRFLRIFPPYWVAVGFSIAALFAASTFVPLKFFDDIDSPELIFSWENIIRNFFYPFYIYRASWFGLEMDFAFVRYIWAVVIELHFYYVAALLYFAASSLSHFSQDRSMLRVAYWPFFFFIFIAGFWLSHFRQNDHLWYFSFGPFFALGMTLHYLQRSKGLMRWINIFGVIISWVFANCHLQSYVARAEEAPVACCMAIFNGLMSVMVALAWLKPPMRFILMDRAAGQLSYPVYLNHYAVSVVFLSIFGAHRGSGSIFVLCAVTCLVVSYGLNIISDTLTCSLRDKIRGARLD